MVSSVDLGVKKQTVCLVVVTYNRLPVLQRSLQAILKLALVPNQIVVVDNGSSDGTIDWLKKSNPGIEVVELGENLGYAAGLAAGIQYAQKHLPPFDFFWLMDDDSNPSNDTLSALLSIKKELAVPGILSVTGFIDTLWNGPVPISRYSNKRKFKLTSRFPLYAVEHALIDGALVDREVVEIIGVPDGRLFMMCEDVEYSKRAIRAGYKVVVWDDETAMARLHQGGGGGFSKSNLWRGYYGARNHLLILKQYFSWKRAFAYFIRQAKYVLVGFRASDWRVRVSLRLLGIWHGMKGVSGKTIDPKKYT